MKAEIGSRDFGVRRAMGMAVAACFAMGLTMACSGNGTDDDSVQEDARDDAPSAIDPHLQTQVRSASVADGTCFTCETKTVCKPQLVSCDPPVTVDGREIKCLQDVCGPEIVCAPCAESSPSDPSLPTLPNLPRPIGNPPVDPLPFP